MWHLFAIVLPLGLSAAVSPVLFTEQMFLVSGPNGRRAAELFLAGCAVVLVVVATAVWFLGRAINLPRLPHLDAAGDVLFGALLLAGALALHLHLRRRRHGDKPPKDVAGRAAFPFGLFSMATNFTTLIIVIAACKEIAASGQEIAVRLGAVVLVAVLACLPAWVPLAADHLPGGSRVLTGVRDQVARHARVVLTGVLLVAGTLLVVRGIVRLS